MLPPPPPPPSCGGGSAPRLSSQKRRDSASRRGRISANEGRAAGLSLQQSTNSSYGGKGGGRRVRRQSGL